MDLEKQVIRHKQPTESSNKQEDTEVKKEGMLKKKRKVHNVIKDKEDFSDEEMGQMGGVNKALKKAKEKLTETKRNKMKDSHLVKFSGNEYKNKAGKGDKLIQGKYEPFAYIQLNPKTTSHRNRKEAIKVFDNIMNPEK